MAAKSGALAAIVAACTVGLVAPPAHAGGDPPVTVTSGGFGIVDTEVTDAGRPARARPSLTRAPARTCVQDISPTAGRAATEAELDSGAPAGAGPGGWVVRRCSDGSLDTGWVAAEPARPQVTAGQLAQRAYGRLRLPLPVPKFDPRRESSAGPTTLVGIPTWFWVGAWAPARQWTQAGGVWAEVSAVPVSSTWLPGDGSEPLRCTGGGRAWRPGEGENASSCRYTYRRTSAAEPDNMYTARVTVVWRVTWRGPGGTGGELPLMERQSTFPVAVAERQTVVTSGGGS